MKNKKPINNGKLWLKKETSPYRGHIIFLTCLTVIATLVSLVFAYLVGYVINSAIDSQENKLWIYKNNECYKSFTDIYNDALNVSSKLITLVSEEIFYKTPKAIEIKNLLVQIIK